MRSSVVFVEVEKNKVAEKGKNSNGLFPLEWTKSGIKINREWLPKFWGNKVGASNSAAPQRVVELGGMDAGGVTCAWGGGRRDARRRRTDSE